ncbi:hypothetical protein SSS_10333 [Sarcoptes scabiei]|nr:hypothetical protein SSS_10333 [Sarcoptes scabiei]
MDSYSSHEGSIYCQLHFKQLFQPKPNFDSNNNDKHLQNSNMDRNDLNATNERNDDDDDDDNDDDYDYGDGGTDNRIKKFNNSTKDSSLGNDIIEAIQKPRKYELIVCENTPVELPPDVIRYDQKQEDVFENLNLNLNSIRNRFENGLVQNEVKDSTKRSSDSVKPISKSESIHKIMQKYQNRVAGKNHSCSSSDDEENQLDQLDDSNHHHRDHHNDSSHRERVSFSGMSNLKNQWETGSFGAENKNDSRSMTENELAEIRRHGKPLKQMYERAVQEAKSNENLSNKHPEAVLADGIVKTETLKAKFENGSLDETDEDRIVRLRKERETEINQIVHNDLALKEARQKFKQIEAKQNNESSSLQDHQCPTAAVAADVSIDAEQLQQRFNYFENHNGINEEEQDRNTSKSVLNDLPKVDTTKKMLSKFKALESGNSNENSVNLNQGPKAPIRITPPRETAKVYENEPVVERDPNIVKSSYKTEEIIQVEPEKAKSLRAKFENWNADDERGNRKNSTEDNELAQFERDSTKNLRAMFESIQNEPKKIERPKPRVNRFVQDKQYQQNELCYVCLIRIYPMEKLEFSGMKLHKNCFRCNKCHMPLRLDNFTQHTEKLFCIPHFKQLFMQKGNYDEGFGREQHKDKWSNKSSNCDNQHRQSTVLASHASSSQNGLIEINGNQSDESTELIDGHLLPDQSISLNGHQFYANINSNERLVENY